MSSRASPEPQVRLEQLFHSIHELSRGGMGCVYRAIDRQTGSPLALKVLLEDADDAEGRERFTREARALASIKHPNILNIARFGWSPQGPFIACEMIEGMSLRSLVEDSFARRAQRPDDSWIRETFAALASALQACHEAGIIHRDIKPENIMIEQRSGRPVLIDFGLVKFSRAPSGQSVEALCDSLTKTGALLGTPAFMGPEQVDAAAWGKPGPPTDIWGLGATLYYTLTGHAPFEEPTLLAQCAALLGRPPETPASWCSELPPDLEAWVLACLQRPPADRPSALELEEGLRSARSPDKKSKNKHSSKLWIVLSSLVAIAAIGILAIPKRDQEAPRLQIDGLNEDAPSLFLSRTKSQITGRVIDQRPAQCFILGLGKKRSIALDAKGEFRIDLELSEREQSLEIAASDESGLITRRSLKLILDEQGPELAAPKVHQRLGRQPLLIKGQASDPGAGLERLEVQELDENGRIQSTSTIPVDGEGHFTLILAPEKSPCSLELIAIDKLGHRSQRTLQILSKKCIAVGAGEKPSWAEERVQELAEALDRAAPDTELICLPGVHLLPQGDLPENLSLRGFRSRDFGAPEAGESKDSEKAASPYGERGPELDLDKRVRIEVPDGLRLAAPNIALRYLTFGGCIQPPGTEFPLGIATIHIVKEGARIEHCEIEASSVGLRIGEAMSPDSRARASVDHCAFPNSQRFAVQLSRNGRLEMKRSSILQGEGDYSIINDGGDIRLSQVTIHGRPCALYFRNGARVLLESCDLKGQRRDAIIAAGEAGETIFEARDLSITDARHLGIAQGIILIRDGATALLQNIKIQGCNSTGIRVRDAKLVLADALFQDNHTGIALDNKGDIKLFAVQFINHSQAAIINRRTSFGNENPVLYYDAQCRFDKASISNHDKATIELKPELNRSREIIPRLSKLPSFP